MQSTMHPPETTLSWRIPENSRISLRFSLLQTAFASVIVGIMVIFLTPAETQGGLLTATMTVAILVALGQILRAWREERRPANVWLDEIGLHWFDSAGKEQLLNRSLAQRFFVGRDPHTQRDRPALTLLLAEGFLSQPIELHAPADVPTVRRWLSERWSLSETQELPEQSPLELPLASELDTTKLRWHLEGNREALTNFASLLREVSRWPLPPLGARPRERELEFENDFVVLSASPHTWIDIHLFAAKPTVLADLAEQIETQLEKPNTTEFTIPLIADTGHHWQLRFDVV